MTKAAKTNARKLIFLGWLVYAISYLGKVNYSANITQIIDFYGITKAEAGAVPTFFFFAYGVGQVVNGLLCKKYNVKWMIFGSLSVSAAVNLTIVLVSDFSVVKWLWMINGIALSVLWPTLIRTLSESLPQKALGLSSVTMGTTVAAGTLAIYGLSSVFALFDNFRLAFYVAAIADVAVSLVWLACYKKAVAISKAERVLDDGTAAKKEENSSGTFSGRLFCVTVGALCFFAICVNLINDGITTWVPSILKEEFSMSDSLSILLTLFLVLVAMFGNAFALATHKRIPDYVTHCGVIFAAVSVTVVGIVGMLSLKIAAAMLIGLVIVRFITASLNSLITSIFPMFMRGRVNSGLMAGVLNGFCYVGSTVSAYGLGVVADNFGWNAVFFTLLGASLLSVLVFCGYFVYKRTVKDV